MTATVNSVAPSTGQPSAPQRVSVINVDADGSYPTGGYDISADLPGTVVASETVQTNLGAQRHSRITSAGKMQVFADDGGSVGAEIGNGTNLGALVNVDIVIWTE